MPVPEKYDLALRQADQARTDFANIEITLEFLMQRIKALPTARDLWRAATLFYVGYQAARFGSRAINVAAIPNAEDWAESYCAEHPDRPAVEAVRHNAGVAHCF